MRDLHRSTDGAGRTPGGGFTLVELMVAMFITVILGSVVVMAYNTSMQSYYRTEKQLQALASFRNTTDRLEREVNSMVFKSSVYPHPVIIGRIQGFNHIIFWDTRVKYLHGDAQINSDDYAWTSTPEDGSTPGAGGPHALGPTLTSDKWWLVNTSDSTQPDAGRSLFQINFRPRYMGYYSTLDGFTVDRTEWYFNPPEERRLWSNGKDDDGDDPEGDVGLRILYDDRGCLMFRKTFDADMRWAEWDAAAGRPNHYRDPYHGPYSRAGFPPEADEQARPLSTADLVASGDLPASPTRQQMIDNGYIVDTGTVIGEGFEDMTFSYIYKLRTSDKFVEAKWWPWDNDSNPINVAMPQGEDANMPKKTIGTTIGGSWKQGIDGLDSYEWEGDHNAADDKDFDISYFTLPMAISVKFTFKVGRQRHIYEKLIYLHASRWLKYLNP